MDKDAEMLAGAEVDNCETCFGRGSALDVEVIIGMGVLECWALMQQC